MKKNGIVVALLVLQSLCLRSSLAADAGGSGARDEFSKQENIFQSKGAQVPGGYVIDRSLVAYADTLPADFDRTLASLGPKDRWLDIGAGMGQAILDYYTPKYDQMHAEGRERRGTKARAVAISIEDRRTPLWQQSAATLSPNQIQYFFSRRLREYAPEELGRFQVITDVIGGFSYAENLALFVQRVLGLLELRGSFYTVLQDVHSEEGSNRPFYANAPYLTEITRSDGSEVKVCSWLKSIGCAEVTCELKMGWNPPIEVYGIRKVCNEVSVPVLVQTKFEAGTPPQRYYRLAN